MKWQVSRDEAGVRLQDFLKKRVSFISSNRALKRFIETNHCAVNGITERFASRKLSFKDEIEWFEPKDREIEKRQFEAQRILYEDEYLLAYDKPSGVSSEASGILKLLKPHGNYLLTHRLDKETSGILLLAKTNDAEKQIIELFKQRQIDKEYLAIVDGCPKEEQGVIENFLGKKGSFDGQTIYGQTGKSSGKYAKTRWKLMKAAKKKAALLKCSPETGRTHQLRVHLSSIGHPILGDYQYGTEFQFKIRPSRMLLHASFMRFKHPFSDKTIEIKAPLPLEFEEIVKKLW